MNRYILALGFGLLLLVAIVAFNISRVDGNEGYQAAPPISRSSSGEQSSPREGSRRTTVVSRRKSELPLSISDWRLSASDQKIFYKLKQDLEAAEQQRIVERCVFNSSHEVSETLRNALNASSDLKRVSTTQVAVGIRAPDPAELGLMSGKIETAIAQSALPPSEKISTQRFFEERFSIKEGKYKVVLKSIIGSYEGDVFDENVASFVCDEFTVEDFDDGGRKIHFHGDQQIEDTKFNPDSGAGERYAHVFENWPD